jgi:hypothetical protein
VILFGRGGRAEASPRFGNEFFFGKSGPRGGVFDRPSMKIAIHSLLRRALSGLGFLVLAAAVIPAYAEPFKIVVIPDTQWAAQKWPDLITDMTKWVAANHEKEDIKYVLHVGDMVQVGGSEEEWQNFSKSMKVLEAAKVPYILGVGNHDYDKISPPKSTVMFNRFFPLERLNKNAGFGATTFPEGKADNSYATFEAGGKNWLVLSLNFAPNDAEIAWGNGIIGEHPDHQVILLTHSYLTHTQRDVAGEVLWERLVRFHPNISMVFCGHLSTVHFTSKGDAGNIVCGPTQWLFQGPPAESKFLL